MKNLIAAVIVTTSLMSVSVQAESSASLPVALAAHIQHNMMQVNQQLTEQLNNDIQENVLETHRSMKESYLQSTQVLLAKSDDENEKSTTPTSAE